MSMEYKVEIMVRELETIKSVPGIQQYRTNMDKTLRLWIAKGY